MHSLPQKKHLQSQFSKIFYIFYIHLRACGLLLPHWLYGCIVTFLYVPPTLAVHQQNSVKPSVRMCITSSTCILMPVHHKKQNCYSLLKTFVDSDTSGPKAPHGTFKHRAAVKACSVLKGESISFEAKVFRIQFYSTPPPNAGENTSL